MDTEYSTLPKMNYKKLGNTGLLVSELCLGAMTFGFKEKNYFGMPTANEEESFAILNAFEVIGGNFIDTADMYGDSEEVIGKWLQNKTRDSFVIATKVRGRVGPGVNDIGLSRSHILSSVEKSLKKLQTTYIDLFQIHYWDTATPLSETFSTLNDLVRVGKVRYIGVSNFCGYQLQEAIDLVNAKGWEPIVCLQPQYNLLCRSTEWDLVKVCQNKGLGIIPWSPLAGGWLAGRVAKDTTAPQEGSRIAWSEAVGWKPTGFNSQSNDRTWAILDVIKKIATETGRTEAQVSLRWLMQKPGVTAPIIGAKNLKQLQDNFGVLAFTLTEDQMKSLDDVSYVQPPYPFSEFWNNTRELNLTPKK